MVNGAGGVAEGGICLNTSNHYLQRCASAARRCRHRAPLHLASPRRAALHLLHSPLRPAGIIPVWEMKPGSRACRRGRDCWNAEGETGVANRYRKAANK
jgi:hypothetical protein